MQDRLSRAGIELDTDGSFLFNPGFHDAEAKVVLGRRLPKGQGIEDGETVLDILAAHPETALFLSKKLAVRFVSDEPPAALVERLASVFDETGGDIASWLRTLVSTPEFWSEGARRQKIKSPFELAVSALRAVDAEVVDARGVARAVSQMGQPLYAYEAPTGYPDRASAWVNSGSLLNRMNFGLQLATAQLPGVRLDLTRLAGGRELSSAELTLARFSELLLPGRDNSALEQLRPMIEDPDLVARIDRAAKAARSDQARGPDSGPGLSGSDADEVLEMPSRSGPGGGGRRGDRGMRRALPADTSVMAQVVGVILGSPEFQRR